MADKELVSILKSAARAIWRQQYGDGMLLGVSDESPDKMIIALRRKVEELEPEVDHNWKELWKRKEN